MTVFVSLFRAINVGGRNIVKMPELKALHESLGFRGISTYLQTGNVIFKSDERDPERVLDALKAGFERKFGFRADIMIRTANELKGVVEKNPFLEQHVQEPQWVVVMFLEGCPDEGAQAELRKAYAGPEKFSFNGRELYIYYPNGIGRSKLSNAYIEKKLKMSGTGRNWNTVAKLLEKMDGSEA